MRQKQTPVTGTATGVGFIAGRDLLGLNYAFLVCDQSCFVLRITDALSV
jgi:hypothetical protein